MLPGSSVMCAWTALVGPVLVARYVSTSTLLLLHQARTRDRSRQTQWQTTTRGGVAATRGPVLPRRFVGW